MLNDLIFYKKRVDQHTIHSRSWFALEGDDGMRLTQAEIAQISRLLAEKTLQQANVKVIYQ